MKKGINEVIVGDEIVISRERRKVERLIPYKGGMVGINFYRNGKMSSRTYTSDQTVQVTS